MRDLGSVAMGDIIMLAGIFCVLVIICLVLAWMNGREGGRNDMTCSDCGGDEISDVQPGHGLIADRMIIRCLDCRREREARDNGDV